MAFLRSISQTEHEPVIVGERVYLRYPLPTDYSAWAAVRAESRFFLERWEPSWPIDELTRAAFRRRLRRYARDVREDLGYPFFVFRDADDVLVGGCILSNVRRGVSQAASLGYWIGERFARQGLMRDAVTALLPFCFDTLRLNRIEAACLPHNEPSKALLAKMGFQEEGRARQYLKIAGHWQDHLLFALVASDRRGPAR